MYKVVVERKVLKQLAAIEEPAYSAITLSLQKLAEDPRPHGYKKLKGRLGYRVRAGNYRILYNIQDNILTVLVVSIGHRRNVYE